MILSKNHRASSSYPLFIAIAGLIALTLCFFALLDKSSSFEAKVGESQMELINQYQEGESYLFYMDIAAIHSGQQAVSGLASGGGYIGGSDCGEVMGYTLWNSGGKECYPTRAGLEIEYEEAFNQAINDYSHLIYLPASNTTRYTLDYSEENFSFIARPERYTDFVTRIMAKGSELPPGATSAKEGKRTISVHYIELGDPIKYGPDGEVG